MSSKSTSIFSGKPFTIFPKKGFTWSINTYKTNKPRKNTTKKSIKKSVKTTTHNPMHKGGRTKRRKNRNHGKSCKH